MAACVEKFNVVGTWVGIGFAVVFSIVALCQSCHQQSSNENLARELHDEQAQLQTKFQKQNTELALRLDRLNVERQTPKLSLTHRAHFRDLEALIVINNGANEAAITSVVFEYAARKPTPQRPAVVGAVEAIPVFYNRRELDEHGHRFVKTFERPEDIAGGKHATFYLAIIDATLGEWTYFGDISINYDDGRSLFVPHVELDVLSHPPSLPR